jgi:hypothetical protein
VALLTRHTRLVSDVHIPDSTQTVIEHSTFRFAGIYRFARVETVRHPERHLMVARDEKETTLVTTEALLEDEEVVDINDERWLLLSIDCASPFYCVGFIARISAMIAGAGIDLLVVSTFSRDWVFVGQSDGPRAAEVLRAAGFAGG